MSNNAAVASAQRRRASVKNDIGPHGDNLKMQDPRAGPDAGRTLGLTDILGIQSRQLRFLKDYQEGNERHWEANDEFLHQLSEKVDELSETQGGSSVADGDDCQLLTETTTRVGALEKEITQLQGIIASLQDDLLQKND
jgi:hypothetical protein